MSKKKTSPKPSPLGQGLSALLGDNNSVLQQPVSRPETGSGSNKAEKRQTPPRDGSPEDIGPVGYLGVDQLQAGKFQPRRRFDEASLGELAQSIKAQGLLQPIIVRKAGTAYEIVAGERRWRAAQLAALHEVPVVIRDFDDKTTLELSILENVQRQDLSALEEAEGYSRLMQEFGHRQEDLSKLMGKSRSHIANTLRLLALPEDVRIALETGAITAGHGRALSGAEDASVILPHIIKRKMSVRQVEAIVRKQKRHTLGTVSTPGLPKPAKPPKDVDTMALEQTLESRLGLKVEVEGKGEKGSLTIHYKTLEQLDELLGRLR